MAVKDGQEKRYSGKNVRGGDHASPYPVSRLAPPVSLVDSAKAIEAASEIVALRTNAELESIVEQMQALQQRARAIMAKAAHDLELFQAECRFRKVAGRVYHLYRRADGRRYFSMLAPDEYTQGVPHEYIASFRYEPNESWTPLEEIEQYDKRRAEIEQFVGARLLESRTKE